MPMGCRTLFAGPKRTQCFSLGLVFELQGFKGILRFEGGGGGAEGKKMHSQCICPSDLDAEGWQRLDLSQGGQDN